jgi:hypothetical protein
MLRKNNTLVNVCIGHVAQNLLFHKQVYIKAKQVNAKSIFVKTSADKSLFLYVCVIACLIRRAPFGCTTPDTGPVFDLAIWNAAPLLFQVQFQLKANLILVSNGLICL